VTIPSAKKQPQLFVDFSPGYKHDKEFHHQTAAPNQHHKFDMQHSLPHLKWKISNG